MTRKQARAAGLTRYFTGKPCKRGHVAERRMSDGCVVCMHQYATAWQKANPEKVKAKGLAYRAVNRERLNAKTAEWRKNNPEKSAALTRAWNEANKEKVKVTKSAWRKREAGAVNEAQMRRFAAKKQRTPKWADLEKIKKVYDLCARFRSLGCDFHVDHVIPLQGRNVCGLHVHNNLEIIEASKNRSKSNQLQGA